jgi:hypothetical protein
MGNHLLWTTRPGRVAVGPRVAPTRAQWGSPGPWWRPGAAIASREGGTPMRARADPGRRRGGTRTLARRAAGDVQDHAVARHHHGVGHPAGLRGG